MADPRLQWRQLSQAQPNTAGFIREMRGGINDAVSTAEGILGRYQEGQETAGDQELARLLASATNQEELNALVNSDKVQGLRLSSEGIGMLNAAQGNRVNWANTRSIMGDRAGRLGIAQDANTRAGEQFGWVRDEHNRNQVQQTWLQNNASAFINAEHRALTEGSSFSAHIGRTESGGADDQYDTLFGHRNRNNGVRVSEMTIGEAGQFASPSGEYGQSVNAEIGRVATPMGKFQIVGTTLRGLQRDLELPDNVPFSPQVQEQLGLFLAQRRIEGRDQQAARNGLRAEWEGFKNVSDAELDVMIDEIRQMPTVTRDSILAAANNSPTISGQPATLQRPTSQTTQTGFGGDDFTAAMAASGKFTPHEILNQVDPLRSAATRGDDLSTTELAQQQKDILAAFLTDAVANPDILTISQAANAVAEAARKSGYFSDNEVLEARRAVEAMVSGSDSLQNILTPNIVDDLKTDRMISDTLADERRRWKGTDVNRAIRDIELFTEDPTETLESVLGIPTDGETRGDYNSEKLRRLLNSLANKYTVEPAVMAVAMRDAFIHDPGDDGEHWWDVDWTRNTMERRFDRDIIEETVQQITPDSRALYDQGKTNLAIMEQQMGQVNAQRKVLRRTLAKLPENSPRRASIEAQLIALDGQLAAIQSNRSVRP